MTFDLICTVFNEEGSIGALLDSLLKQSMKPNKIIIVDGGSEDNTAQIIKEYALRDSIIDFVIDESCSLTHTAGPIARGRNVGIARSNADFLIFVDAGCCYHEKWLEAYVDYFSNGAEIVAGGAMLGPNATLADKLFAPFLGYDCWDNGYTAAPTGTCRSLGVKSELIEIVGGFDEASRTGEDTDFYLKLKELRTCAPNRAKGCAAVYTPSYALGGAISRLKSYAFGDGVFGQARLRVFFMAARISLFAVSALMIIIFNQFAVAFLYLLFEMIVSVRRSINFLQRKPDISNVFLELGRFIVSLIIPFVYVYGYVEGWRCKRIRIQRLQKI